VIKQNGVILADPLVTEYGYDLDGNLTTIADPNGVTTTNDYDAFNRLDSVTTTNSTNHKLFEQDYTLLPDGQRDYVTETRYDGTSNTPFSKVRISWTYDNEDRLTSETRDTDPTPATTDSDDFGSRDTIAGGDYMDVFTLDLVGNRLKLQHGWDANADGQLTGAEIDATTDYTYTERDQLLTETRTGDKPYTTVYGHYSGTTLIPGYDANGSLIEKHRTTTDPNPDSTNAPEDDAYTWDIRGRMTSTIINGTTTTIGYDSDGQRVSEQTGTDPTTYYVNDKSNPTGFPQIIEERSGTSPASATLVRSYTIGQRVEGQADIADTTVSVTFYIIDGHGSTRSLVDSAGHEVQRYDYRAFGEGQYFAAYDSGTQTWTAITPTDVLTIHLFAGDSETDNATGLSYHDARWRDGFHFVSWDPAENNWADPQSLHKYLYADANPVGFNDPTGHLAGGTTEQIETQSIGERLTSLLLPGIRSARAASLLLRGSTSFYMSAAQLLARGVTYYSALYGSYMTLRSGLDACQTTIERAIDEAIWTEVVTHALHHQVLSQNDLKNLDDLSEENLGRHIYQHYSFVSSAASFANGMWPNPTFVPPGANVQLRSYGTQDVYATGWQAHWYLALGSDKIQNAEYIVMPKKGYEPIGPSPVAGGVDAAGNLLGGGGSEYLFWNGSGGAGTVFGPIPLPVGQSPAMQN
jgi:YD repeat-containing protein